MILTACVVLYQPMLYCSTSQNCTMYCIWKRCVLLSQHQRRVVLPYLPTPYFTVYIPTLCCTYPRCTVLTHVVCYLNMSYYIPTYVVLYLTCPCCTVTYSYCTLSTHVVLYLLMLYCTYPCCTVPTHVVLYLPRFAALQSLVCIEDSCSFLQSSSRL